MEKQDHHECRRQEGALAKPAKCAQRSGQERNSGHQQGQTEVREGVEREVQHVAERKRIGAGVAAESVGDITGRREISNGNKYRETRNGGDSRNSTKHARSTAYPISSRGHCGAQQQRERRVARHGIVFLGRSESEKDQKKASPTKREEAYPSGAVDRFVRELRNRRKVDAPWK